jgi:ribonuclease BN (tRNA processing enzyme)
MRSAPRVPRLAAVCGLLAALGAAAPLPAQSTPAPASPRTKLVVLGTGTPNADPDRSGPAVAVVVDSASYLIDAGPGIVRRAAAAARTHGLPALTPPRLDIVFITHLHSDHTVGLPDLILTPWVLERTAPLRVYGPPGTRAMVEHLLAAYGEDVRNRIDGAEPANETGHHVAVTEVRPGVVHRDDRVTVRAFAVPHGDWRDGTSLAYRFETPDRTILVSGDTRASETIVEACAGCDLLVHEVYSADRFRTRPPEWQRYHARAHTSTTELAGIATRARPRLLVLYHQLYWGATDDDLLAEIRRSYRGEVRSARDLGVY